MIKDTKGGKVIVTMFLTEQLSHGAYYIYAGVSLARPNDHEKPGDQVSQWDLKAEDNALRQVHMRGFLSDMNAYQFIAMEEVFMDAYQPSAKDCVLLGKVMTRIQKQIQDDVRKRSDYSPESHLVAYAKAMKVDRIVYRKMDRNEFPINKDALLAVFRTQVRQFRERCYPGSIAA